MDDDFKQAVECFEQFCLNNGVKPTDMKAEYYIAGFLRGKKYDQEEARPLAWQNAKFTPPEVVVKVHKEDDSNLLATTEEVLCLHKGKAYVDKRRLFGKFGNQENVWVWRTLEGCEKENVYWQQIIKPTNAD